ALDDVVVGPERVRRGDVGLLARRREHDHGEATGARVGPEPPQHLEAVDLGELQVEQDHTRHDADLVPRMAAVAEKKVQRLGAVACHEHLVRDVALLEGPQRELLVVRVVLDQQDFDFVGEIHARPYSGRVIEREALAARTTPGGSRGAARPKWGARLPENRVPSGPRYRRRPRPKLSRSDRPCRKNALLPGRPTPMLLPAPRNNLGVFSVAWSPQPRVCESGAAGQVTSLTLFQLGTHTLVGMGKPLRVLMVEDSEDDALLVLRELRAAGYDLTHERVDTAAALVAALDRHPWDLVIGDYSMPHFSGTAALAMLRQRGLDVPYICVSGTITEELAVAAMKAGAHDYVTKGHLKRLLPAIERELREARARATLRATEASFATLVEHAPVGIYRSSPEGRFLSANGALVRMLGYESAADVLGLDMGRDVYADPAERQRLVERDTYSNRQYDNVEATWKRRD